MEEREILLNLREYKLTKMLLALRIGNCGFGPFCSTGTKLLLSISLLMVLMCIIYQKCFLILNFFGQAYLTYQFVLTIENLQTWT